MGPSDSRIQPNGEKSVVCRPHPADFAHRLRTLAADTHRALRNPETEPHELIELSERFDELRRGAEDQRLSEIDRWLRNAQDLLERRM